LPGATVIFQIGTSETSALTDSNGVGQANVKFSPDGNHTILVFYLGTNLIKPALISSQLPTYNVNLKILNSTFAAELVGGSNVVVAAQLTLTNGTPVPGATLVFHIGTSTGSAVTDSNGIAQALVTLPTEGTFTINVTYSGTNLIVETAGTSSSFVVISPATIATQQLIQYVIWGLITAAIVIGSYVTLQRGIIRPRQRKRHAEYAGLMDRFEDARNILLLMVINRESGTEIYSKALGGVPVDPTLVSGFLQALTSFSQEILTEERATKLSGSRGKAKKTLFPEVQTLAFHHFKIIMQDGPNLRVALLLLKAPSKKVVTSLRKFAEHVENKFGPRLNGLHGKQLEDDEIWDSIDQHFEPSLTFLHMLDFEVVGTLSQDKMEKAVLEAIKEAPNFGEVYLDSFAEELSARFVGKKLEILQACLSMRQRKALLPLNPLYMEFRLGIKKAIENLPDTHKDLIKSIGEGQRDLEALMARIKVTEEQLETIIVELKEFGMLTEDLHLDMAGKVVYTTLRCGEFCLS
jgi:hypothetical protein